MTEFCYPNATVAADSVACSCLSLSVHAYVSLQYMREVTQRGLVIFRLFLDNFILSPLPVKAFAPSFMHGVLIFCLFDTKIT